MRSIRRSRSAVGLLAAALLVAASSCGADQRDQSTSPAATDPTDLIDPPDTTSPPPDTTSGWSTTTHDLDSLTMLESVAVPVSAPFDAAAGDPDFVSVWWLVPWADGFLAAGVRYPPQPLPEQLPPEIADLFPPEVVALFPDGLPPTQQEATDILEEADLFDDVMDVLNEHPEAMDAIQSAPRPDSELAASWSADGDTWTPTDITLPDGFGDITQLVASGDRLTTAGTAVPTEDGQPWIVTVASTTDLENWTTKSLEITPPEDLPDDALVWVTPIAIAADDENWVARVMVDASTDPFGSVQAPQTRVELWSGSWDGEPTVTVEDQQFGALLTTSAGFLDFGESVSFSPDGQTWTEVYGPGPISWLQAAASLGDDVIALIGTPSGETSIHLLDATGTNWTEVEIPGLDGTFSGWSSTSSPAFILAMGAPTPGLWLLATADGEAWLLEDLDEGDLDSPNLAQFVAINGTTVLVGTPGWEPDNEVWQRFTLTQ